MPRIAIAQLQSSTDKQTNLRNADAFIGDASGSKADLIVFPEFLMAYSPADQSAKELAAIAEPLDGPFVMALRGAAKAAGIGLVATIYENSSSTDRVYDTAVWIDATGTVSAVYRKLHLYDAFGFKESDKFHPGQELAPLTDLHDCRFGMMICYDLRFPEMARMLALEGADVLIAPSGWVQGELKVEHWQTMVRARALENGCYVIAPDQVGNIYIGRSMAVDPLGRTLMDLQESQALKIVEVDSRLVRETRQKLPLLQNRRTDVYLRHAALRQSA